MRYACLKRDDYQCTATLRDGTRCPETTQLEAHHIKQYQPGERADLNNLTTLCAWHHSKITQRQAAAGRRRNALPRNRREERHPGLL